MFAPNQPETEQDGKKAREMRVARLRHQHRELARLSAKARQTQTPPAEPQLIDMDSLLHYRLQEPPVNKMKELIRLRTRRESEQAESSSRQPPSREERTMEAEALANDSAKQPLVRGHRSYPVGGQMDRVPASEPGEWLRKPPDASKLK